jgi:uncharacterized membrane protein
MAAGKQRDERALDHQILAEDNAGGGLMSALHLLGGGFQARDDVVIGRCQCCHRVRPTSGVA